MKTNAKWLFLVSLFIVFSCQDEEIKGVHAEDYLTKSSWTLKFKEKTTIENHMLINVDSIKTDNVLNREVLTFSKNRSIKYEYGQLIDPLFGHWSLSQDKKTLTTDLSLNLAAATGYSSKYFYISPEILEISQDKLTLKEIRKQEYSSWQGGVQKVDTIEFIARSFFEH